MRRELTHHAKLYYVYDSPIISDYEYDMMFADLKRLEEEHPEFFDPSSPSQRVGGKPLDKFIAPPIKHMPRGGFNLSFLISHDLNPLIW